MKQLDIVRTPKGGIAIITNITTRTSSVKPMSFGYSIRFLDDNPGKERRAWWERDELSVINNLDNFLIGGRVERYSLYDLSMINNLGKFLAKNLYSIESSDCAQFADINMPIKFEYNNISKEKQLKFYNEKLSRYKEDLVDCNTLRDISTEHIEKMIEYYQNKINEIK